jgi:hypothetical protein
VRFYSARQGSAKRNDPAAAGLCELCVSNEQGEWAVKLIL